tara:strand:- start:616 stop:930 length:315 start_codon:yes stop_codon:yes gene_type:complete
MYRSQEILQIFNELNIPEPISKYILEYERKLLFKESLHNWMYLSQIAKRVKFKRFFYEENNILFLQEIRDINGNIDNLKKYKLKLWNIQTKNQYYAIYLKSLRY